MDETGKPVGVFSFRDMAKYFLDPALETGGTGTAGMAKISELMTPKVHSVRPEATMEECRRAMRQHKTHRMLVQDAQGKIVGIISASDLALGLRTHEYRAAASPALTFPLPCPVVFPRARQGKAKGKVKGKGGRCAAR